MTSQHAGWQNKKRWGETAVFLTGLLLLIGTGVVWFWWVSLFTEALLVPWDCCGLDVLPRPGTWQRAVNDFFAGSPGSILPSVLFLLAEAAVLIWRMTKTPNKAVQPLLAAIANIILLAADLAAANLSWAVSDAIVGPREGIDAGFHRTWYGIAAHLLLWLGFLWVLNKVQLPRQPNDLDQSGKGLTE